MNDFFLYFAYGSNMYSPRLQKRTPSALSVETGYVEGYRLTFDKVSDDGSGKCNIAPVTSGERVYGVLFRIDRAEANALDRAEGLGKGYRKGELVVVGATASHRAAAYLADRTDELLQPYGWYKEFVLTGAVEHALPEEYVRGLQLALSKPDHDAARSEKNMALLISTPELPPSI